MNADVSIVIPTWNGVELLKQFFPSVIAAARRYCETTGNRAEIILVDDGSVDATPDWFRAQPSGDAPPLVEMRLVVNATNIGFCKSINRGVREARHPYVLLLNNDVEVNVDAIAPLTRHFSDPAVFAAHFRVFEYGSRRECGSGQLGGFHRGSIRVHQGYRVAEQTQAGLSPLYSMFASGGSALFDREKFLAFGAFEVLLSPGYWEDVEMSYRAWKRGCAVVYEPRAIAWHQVSSTMRRLNQSRLRRLQLRNRLIFHWIHLHENRYWLPHLLWVGALFITAPLRLQPLYALAVVDAVRLLPQIRRRRREERALARRRDHEVFQIFAELRKRKDVLV
jgi:GT2 family glycosyltransferase